ncbi:MAG: sulfatase-like hydrolase/transferase [Chitinophagaceae bacterium]|nr:sulfatase-like hydrolase/transferase [Chitinophagaceae bacterium]
MNKEIWWNFTTRFKFLRPSAKYWNELQEKKTRYLHKTHQSLSDELQKSSSKPRFVMGHYLLPHSPFIFDSAGNSRIWDTHPQWMTDSLYFDQVKYANTLIKDLVTKATAKSDRPKVFILMGDHGLRDFHLKLKDRIREKEMMNLMAIYYENREYSSLYDSISPVNIFRTLLNDQFKTKLPILKDSTVFLQ